MINSWITVPFDRHISEKDKFPSEVYKINSDLNIPNQDKPIVFSSNRRRQKQMIDKNKSEEELILASAKSKSVIASKDTSTQGVSHKTKYSMP